MSTVLEPAAPAKPKRQFFVNPKAVDRLFPWGEDDPHYVDVKRDLSARDEQEIKAAGIPHMLQKPAAEGSAEADPSAADGREVKMGLDIGRMSAVRMRKFIVGWSLVDDEDGTPIPVSEQTIGELLPDVFGAIDKAIDVHKKAQAAKKAGAQAGVTTPKPA